MSICLQYFLRVVTPMSSLAAAFEMGRWTTAATSVIDNDRALQIAVFSRRYKGTQERCGTDLVTEAWSPCCFLFITS